MTVVAYKDFEGGAQYELRLLLRIYLFYFDNELTNEEIVG